MKMIKSSLLVMNICVVALLNGCVVSPEIRLASLDVPGHSAD